MFRYEAVDWCGNVIATSNIAQPIIDAEHEAISDALNDTDVRNRLAPNHGFWIGQTRPLWRDFKGESCDNGASADVMRMRYLFAYVCRFRHTF